MTINNATSNEQIRMTHGQEHQVATETNYRVHLSERSEDVIWDRFLNECSDGHHTQTSLWAQIKILSGWRVIRIVVTLGDTIVAGAQLLIRPLPFLGQVGYVSKGPVFALHDPKLIALVLSELQRVARIYRIHYLAVQPASCDAELAQQLSIYKFQPSPLAVMPTATVCNDLSLKPDEILAQMSKSTRTNIRQGQRQGLIVREGNKEDIHAFYQLLTATGQRQNFSPEPESYYLALWDVLYPRGHLKLFFAEYNGEPISAALVILFGNTAVYKRGAWSGIHGNLHPNEGLHWGIIQWAQTHGYRYYDFEGIDREGAKAILRGEKLPDSLLNTTTRFKLKFGGQPILLPGVYSYLYNPVLRWSYNTIFRKMVSSPFVTEMINRVRKQRHINRGAAQ
jgi:lipid II:glycine glycyltransferase (peptidoglycan interpeptide bridge formation enzyme)